ncbi:MAG: helix-turn-helix domain-containing protein [Clostridiaceae bacterium]
MNEIYYNVEQIAKMLNIHPKTIQRYIREGKLHATKIGKSWRVTGHDLSRFTEGTSTTTAGIQATPQVKVHAKASSVVDISVTDNNEAMRITNSLNATMNAKPQEYGHASMHMQFLENDNTLRISLWGTVQFMSVIMSAIETFTENDDER